MVSILLLIEPSGLRQLLIKKKCLACIGREEFSTIRIVPRRIFRGPPRPQDKKKTISLWPYLKKSMSKISKKFEKHCLTATATNIKTTKKN